MNKEREKDIRKYNNISYLKNTGSPTNFKATEGYHTISHQKADRSPDERGI
jgi:hypothetical protein